MSKMRSGYQNKESDEQDCWLDLPYDQVDTALDFAQVLVDEERVQYQERILQFPQETINDDFVFMLGTREEAR
eukprot:5805278-Amphidinium_carterae.1